MQELLLGYLLEMLEPDERAEVERKLASDPVWQAELQRLQAALNPLAADQEPFEPPPGLVEQTCSFVAQNSDLPVELTEHRAPRWRLLDVLAVAAVCLAGFLLLVPAVSMARYQAHVTCCQHKLRQLGLALVQYSQAHQGCFPALPRQGRLSVAGFYAPLLIKEGYLTEPRTVICPGSPLACEREFTVPTLEAVQTATPCQLKRLQQQLGGSYGYSLGQEVDGMVVPARNLARPNFALAADAPSETENQQSLNHAGEGQNVLFEDGHVVFWPKACPNAGADHIFLNRQGQVRPGTTVDDAVLAPSATAP